MFFSFLLGVLLTLWILLRYRHMWAHRTLPAENVRRVVRRLVREADEISRTYDPRDAMLRSRACQCALDTLIDAVGGGCATIDAMCDVDTEALQNLLSQQQEQLRQLQ